MTEVNGKDPVLGALQDAITEYVEKTAVVTSYVVMASFMNAEGERHTYCDTMDGQRAHETMGLLAFGTAHEQAHVFKQLMEDDE